MKNKYLLLANITAPSHSAFKLLCTEYLYMPVTTYFRKGFLSAYFVNNCKRKVKLK